MRRSGKTIPIVWKMKGIEKGILLPVKSFPSLFSLSSFLFFFSHEAVVKGKEQSGML